ncbi:hypothetical protein BGZ88_000706 [Linnemannia elongata]|nr:hypothetical protein BGZ88_000706 [Linnemannia elongata]
MSETPETRAQLQKRHASLTIDIERVSQRIAAQEKQIGVFRETAKKTAEPLYDPTEFKRARQDMQKTLEDHKSPTMNSNIATAISLLEMLDIGEPEVSEVVQVREKLRQTLHTNSNIFIASIEKSLEADRARLARDQAKLDEVNNLIK